MFAEGIQIVAKGGQGVVGPSVHHFPPHGEFAGFSQPVVSLLRKKHVLLVIVSVEGICRLTYHHIVMVTIVHAVDSVYGVRCEAQIKIVVAFGRNDSQVVPFMRVPDILRTPLQHIAPHLVIGVNAGCAFGTAVIKVGILQVVQFPVVPHLVVLQPDILV